MFPISLPAYSEVVPTVYNSLKGSMTIRSNQYSVTEHERELGHDAGHGVPGVYFMYDMSPITVQYTERKQSVAHLLTSLLAILGGVFSIASLIDAGLHRLLRKFGAGGALAAGR